ncbi:MAG: tetratricopeptide repeat protein [Candidatus Eisenbacteria bacterium]
MANIIDSRIERLLRARSHPTDVWQGGIFRMPVWVTEKRESPYRASAAVWLSVETGRAFSGDLLKPEEVGPACALDALAKAASRGNLAGYRPRRLEVADPALAEYLRRGLSDLGIDVSVSDRLDRVDEFLRLMGEEMSGPLGVSSSLKAPGVTLERMRAFADAAFAFHRAALWNHLTDEDIIRVESPVPEPGLSHFVVLGGAGIARGLGFFPSIDEFEAFLTAEDPRRHVLARDAWHLDFDPIWAIPLPDADLWEEHRLAVASPEAYPYAYCSEKWRSFRRPDASRLAFLEGLIRALAATTEDDLDSGRWAKETPTFDGGGQVALALPRLLEPRPDDVRCQDGKLPDRRLLEKTLRAAGQLLEEKEFDSIEEANAFLRRQLPERGTPSLRTDTPREKAEELFYRALEAEGRLQIKLARQALATDSDCADAYVLLAERMPDPARRLELYRKGMEAGERSIGKRAFQEDAGRFWGIVETRPYMRARFGVAECLRESGRIDEAIEHYHELMRLNPGDNQGIRLILAPFLLERGLDEDAGRLLDQHAEDGSAPMAYARALLAYRKEGDTSSARACRAKACKENPHMARFLVGKREIPDELPDAYSFGSEEEAILFAPGALPAWQQTPGAIEWLNRDRRDRKKAAPKKRRR